MLKWYNALRTIIDYNFRRIKLAYYDTNISQETMTIWQTFFFFKFCFSHVKYAFTRRSFIIIVEITIEISLWGYKKQVVFFSLPLNIKIIIYIVFHN